MWLVIVAAAAGIAAALVVTGALLARRYHDPPPGVAWIAARCLALLRFLVGLLGRLSRSGAARPLRLGLRGVIGASRYDRLRFAVWVRTKEAVRMDPLHADVLPLIERLDSDGHLMAGAAERLRSVALGIRAEATGEARASG